MRDVTKHNEELHKTHISGLIIEHTPAWYEFWGNKCPVCGVDPEFEDGPQ
jgi:hypothetical protein